MAYTGPAQVSKDHRLETVASAPGPDHPRKIVTARDKAERTPTSREIEPSGEERTVKMDFPRSLLGETR